MGNIQLDISMYDSRGGISLAKNKLSIYLIKTGIPDDAIFKEELDVLQEYGIEKVAYYVPSSIHPPQWLNSFFNLDNQRLLQANSRVVLLVKRNYQGVIRTFAITFGYAKNLFKEGVLEEQFGLKIVLNSVQENELRKISKINIGGNQKQSQEQIPKSGKITDFGFDVDRDLVKNLTASTKEECFEKAIITGGDIFSLAVEKNIDNIEEFLDLCYEKFLDTSYKDAFDWIDNIQAVKDKSLHSSLDAFLIDLINQRQFENVWMAIPEVISWETLHCFKYSGSREEYKDIDIEDFIATIEEQPISSIDRFKNKEIRAISAIDYTKLYTWSGLKCLIAEIEYNGNSYCLNNGKWYKIDNDFVQTVKHDYSQIEISDLEFHNYNSNGRSNYDEGAYNTEFSNNGNSALIHIIGEISFGGGSGNKIEVCDVLTQNKEIIHIKKNAGSSQLSHLFNQAIVSAEALLDSSFRDKWKEKLLEHGYGDFIDENYNSSNYTIIFGIINKFNETRPKIPFFSQVSIRYAARSLKNMGYEVKLKNILNLDI